MRYGYKVKAGKCWCFVGGLAKIVDGIVRVVTLGNFATSFDMWAIYTCTKRRIDKLRGLKPKWYYKK